MHLFREMAQAQRPARYKTFSSPSIIHHYADSSKNVNRENSVCSWYQIVPYSFGAFSETSCGRSAWLPSFRAGALLAQTLGALNLKKAHEGNGCEERLRCENLSGRPAQSLLLMIRTADGI